MSERVAEVIKRFVKYGMDISQYKISSIEDRYELFAYIEIYINKLVDNESLTFVCEENFYVLKNKIPVLAFAITSDNHTILPVLLSQKVEDDELVYKLIRAFLLMVKDLSEFWPQEQGDIVEITENTLNEIKKINLSFKKGKKYNVRELLKEVKKI